MSSSDHRVPLSRSDNFWPHFLDPLRDIGTSISNFFSPSVDALHSNANYEINVELPGVSEEEVDISVEGGFLSIKGEKKFHNEEYKNNYYISERRYGAFLRRFRVPSDVLENDISATFGKGVLKICLPRESTTTSEKRRIDIGKGD